MITNETKDLPKDILNIFTKNKVSLLLYNNGDKIDIKQ